MAGALSQPINTDYSQVRDQYINSQMGLLQPQFQMAQSTLNSQLQNQGVAQGSDAWNNAQRQQNNLISQSYANILGNAQNMVGSAIQQQESLRDQPLNEASALLTGSQVNQGQFTQVPTTQVSPTNIYTPYEMQMQQQNLQYQANLQAQQSALGGIGGLAGSILAAPMSGGGSVAGSLIGRISDRRLKTDEKEVGRLMLPGGELPIKTFRYKGDPVRRMGMIAQDVEKVDPSAVFTHPVTGVKGISYARILLGAHHYGMGVRNGNGNGNGSGTP